MESQEFSRLRKKLNKTQKQLSELLGASLKAVHSYEQGWRGIPVHVERQLLFLVFLSNEGLQNKTCWETLNCPAFRKENCPAWEFKAGTMCWFINGTICEGEAQKNWSEKIKICRTCKVLTSLI
ncbi:MAG: transcriptional regulator [Deltaproteobacteria bacterium]|nr:transcriptional regulator [Deltaproteobacteria bacterium]